MASAPDATNKAVHDDYNCGGARPVAAIGIDRLFLALALAATAVLVALVLLDGQPASAALILGGFGLGVAFLKAEFSYTASWRRFLTRGEAGGLLGGLIVIAVCALAVVPVAALKSNFGGAIAPLGPSLIIGAFVFGVGMQLANGCGSGTLYTVGGGSGRMLIALSFFMAGSVLGSLSLPSFLALGGVDPVLASDYLGALGRIGGDLDERRAGRGADRRGARKRAARQFHAVTQLYYRRPRHRPPVRRRVRRRRSPLERDLRLHGMGRQDRERARRRFLAGRVLAVAGPQARARGIGALRYLEPDRLRHVVRRHGGGRGEQAVRARAWPPVKSLLAAGVGGLLMGWGARLGFGCNIGAFVGGVASGSLHGWVWFAAALPGCLIGISLRPLFGLSAE